MLFIFQGPSGSGKTTQAEKLARRPGFYKITTATTRSPRPGEIDGIDYYFLTESDYDARLKRGEFAAPTAIHGARYGIPKDALEKAAFDKTRHAVLVLDAKGAEELRAMGAVIICLRLSEKERHSRLMKRKETGRFKKEPTENFLCDHILESTGDEDAVFEKLDAIVQSYL
ncbi:MAG: guanylate kinase [Peptoniphilus sp.]|nr:guanylate kinase [Peptoniphilus sp.]MDD7363772.1 guanylate kinase [Bacillota bacterium]MDY6044613.1 guanylate kinase [Peptoniphilus sp.]